MRLQNFDDLLSERYAPPQYHTDNFAGPAAHFAHEQAAGNEVRPLAECEWAKEAQLSGYLAVH